MHYEYMKNIVILYYKNIFANQKLYYKLLNLRFSEKKILIEKIEIYSIYLAGLQ